MANLPNLRLFVCVIKMSDPDGPSHFTHVNRRLSCTPKSSYISSDKMILVHDIIFLAACCGL
jgi:hypothetical protein